MSGISESTSESTATSEPGNSSDPSSNSSAISSAIASVLFNVRQVLKSLHSGVSPKKISFKHFSLSGKQGRKNTRILGLLILIVILIALTLLGYFYYKKSAGAHPGFGGMPVEATTVKIKPLQRNILATGLLQADQSIIIRPEISGRVAEIFFKEGQYVEQGMPLVKLEESIAKATLQEITAQYNLSKAEYERAATLLQKGVGSINDRDVAFSKFQTNEAALARAQATLAKMTILAPFSGTVGLKKISLGDFVNAGQDIVNLVDHDPIKVDFRIPEIYLKEVKLDQTIEIATDAFKDHKFTGKIYAIDPAIDPLAHSLLIRAYVPNTENLLKPGLFVTVNLILNQKQDALTVPDQAIVPMQGKHFVYKIKDGKADLVEVSLGERSNNEVEITKGLMPNDLIITAGQMKIKPGFPVNPVNLPKASQ